VPVAELPSKPVQDRFVESATNSKPQKSTQTAEALVPSGSVAAAAQSRPGN